MYSQTLRFNLGKKKKQNKKQQKQIPKGPKLKGLKFHTPMNGMRWPIPFQMFPYLLYLDTYIPDSMAIFHPVHMFSLHSWLSPLLIPSSSEILILLQHFLSARWITLDCESLETELCIYLFFCYNITSEVFLTNTDEKWTIKRQSTCRSTANR